MSNLNFSHGTLTNRKLLTFQERRKKKVLPAKLTVAGPDLCRAQFDHCNDSLMAYLHLNLCS